MNYFVIGSDGKKYGPADIATLNQWIIDGRVTPTTMLEDATTGSQLVARAVNGLTFSTVPPAGGPPAPGAPVSPYAANPYATGSGPSPFSANYGSNYQQPRGVSSNEMTQAIVCTIVSPILSFFCIFGLATSLYGIRVGIRMKEEGSNLGFLFIGLNVLWLILWVVTRFFWHLLPTRTLFGY